MTGCCIFPCPLASAVPAKPPRALAQDHDGRVLVVDDHRITLTLARSIRNAVSLLDQGKTAEEVKAILGGGSGRLQHLRGGEHLGVPAEKRPGYRRWGRHGHHPPY